jgi:hypothetical protein
MKGTMRPELPRRLSGRAVELSVVERQRILLLKASGRSVSAIARQTGHTRRTVARVLRSPEAKDLIDSAREILLENVPQFAADHVKSSATAAERGRHEAALAALLHLKVLEPVAKEMPGGVQRILGSVLPGMPDFSRDGAEANVVLGDVAAPTTRREPDTE